MSNETPKLYVHKPKKAQLKKHLQQQQQSRASPSPVSSSSSMASQSTTVASSSSSVPPAPPKESFARRYRFLWPLLLAVNFSVGDRFWDRVRVALERQLGKPDGYRTDHQCTSKYKDINTKVSKFSAIYNNIYNTRRSGTSDPIPTVEVTPRSSKRSKTSESNHDSMTASSDARAPFNLNDDDEYDDVEPIEPIRPVGRNKAKRPTSTSTGTGSKESVTTLLDSLSKIHTDNLEFISCRKKELELKAAERMEKDYEFYIRSHDHLTGGALATTLMMKETIRNKYGWPPL